MNPALGRALAHRLLRYLAAAAGGGLATFVASTWRGRRDVASNFVALLMPLALAPARRMLATRPAVRDGLAIAAAEAAHLKMHSWAGGEGAFVDLVKRAGYAESALTIPLDKNAGPAIEAVVLSPADAAGPLPVVVYFHGGGLCLGSSRDPFLAQLDLLARLEKRAIVVSVEYRLAPRHPFPAGIDDGIRATQWLAKHAASVGGDPSAISVVGVSSGGTIAAAVHQRCAQDKVPLRHVSMLFPPLRRGATTPSYITNADEGPLPASLMTWFWLASTVAADAADPRCEAIRGLDRKSFKASAMAPCCVAVADLDVLRDEGHEYAQALVAKGVECELVAFRGTHAIAVATEPATTKRLLEKLVRATVGDGKAVKQA